MEDNPQYLSEDRDALLRAISLHLHLQSTQHKLSVQLTLFGVGTALLGVMLLFALTMIHSVFYIIALVTGSLAFLLLVYRSWTVLEQQQRIGSRIDQLTEGIPNYELFESGDEISQADLEAFSESVLNLNDT